MNRKTLLALTASLLLAGAAAVAQDAPPPPNAPVPTAMKHGMHEGMHGHMGRHDFGPGHGMRGMHGPSGAVIGDLAGIERIYHMSGKDSELISLYEDVLNKTQDPQVRNYVYRHLARAQMRPAHTEEAVATLRKSLDENLDRLNKHEAQMKAWKAEHAKKR